jgi:riboflavin kinase/FMN adenylyltransferase
MRVLRHYTNTPKTCRNAVVVIGNFDGVHLGHRAVLREAADIAQGIGAKVGVITFEPHPREFFAADAPSFRLTPLRPKARLLEELGIDFLLAVHFDKAFSEKSAEEFIEDILVDGLAVQYVVIGYDFVFGYRRRGNADLLRDYAARRGFGLKIIDPVRRDEEVYSSTRIRNYLKNGNPRAAAELLGHFWEIDGRVIEGDKRGRTIGFPTANIETQGYIEPAHGVYAVKCAIEEDGGRPAWRDGVANLGVRPTVGGESVLLEVHLFDFEGDLYGKHMRIALIDHVRPEAKFDGLDALKAQIARDCEAAREILSAVDFPA